MSRDDGLDLAAIRRRADAATAGPWRTAWPRGMRRWEVCISLDLPAIQMEPDPQGIADAAFIAAARTDLPALLDHVERLRTCLAALVAQYDSTDPWATDESRAEWDRARTLADGIATHA